MSSIKRRTTIVATLLQIRMVITNSNHNKQQQDYKIKVEAWTSEAGKDRADPPGWAGNPRGRREATWVCLGALRGSLGLLGLRV